MNIGLLGAAVGVEALVVEPDLTDGFSGVEIPPGVVAPVEIVGQVSWDRFPGTRFGLALALDVETGRYVVTRFDVQDSSGISTDDLHRYSLPKLVSSLASAAVAVDLAAVPFVANDELVRIEDLFSQLDRGAVAERVNASGPSPEALTLVGLVYTYAHVVGLNPNDSVARIFELAKRTATRWIARAKEMGVIAVNG